MTSRRFDWAEWLELFGLRTNDIGRQRAACALQSQRVFRWTDWRSTLQRSLEHRQGEWRFASLNPSSFARTRLYILATRGSQTLHSHWAARTPPSRESSQSAFAGLAVR